MKNIADLRKEYSIQNLSETDLEPNPYLQFNKWWDEAIQTEIEEVNAMTLATATRAGIPSARVVLLKEYSEKGFVFFSNYESDKGHELAQNPNACLVFYWKELERQVRISGNVEKISADESDAYFLSRPTDSQVGAWASPQSRVIASRSIIEEKVLELKKEFSVTGISRPPHWGGYIVKPVFVEFWQGRPSRLHDRLKYSLQDNGEWKTERLAP